MARKTRRSFLIGGAATAATIAAYEWLSHAKQIGQLESPLRRAEQFNAAVSRTLFREKPLAPTYSASHATELRLNGDIGLDPNMILDSWRLQVVGLAHPQQYKQYIEDVDLWEYRSTDDPQNAAPPPTEQPSPKLKPGALPHVDQTINLAIPKAPSTDTTRTPGIVLSLDDLRALPFAEQITQFKCIEGWSQITSFGGTRFADFLKA
ncbi:MAG: molybdopterin-binding oxidoreductase, partial [Granulicella sp.]